MNWILEQLGLFPVSERNRILMENKKLLCDIAKARLDASIELARSSHYRKAYSAKLKKAVLLEDRLSAADADIAEFSKEVTQLRKEVQKLRRDARRHRREARSWKVFFGEWLEWMDAQ